LALRALPYGARKSISTGGIGNTAVGLQALAGNTVGRGNIALGIGATGHIALLAAFQKRDQADGSSE
jgi:hypothetical protein